MKKTEMVECLIDKAVLIDQPMKLTVDRHGDIRIREMSASYSDMFVMEQLTPSQQVAARKVNTAVKTQGDGSIRRVVTTERQGLLRDTIETVADELKTKLLRCLSAEYDKPENTLIYRFYRKQFESKRYPDLYELILSLYDYAENNSSKLVGKDKNQIKTNFIALMQVIKDKYEQASRNRR